MCQWQQQKGRMCIYEPEKKIYQLAIRDKMGGDMKLSAEYLVHSVQA